MTATTTFVRFRGVRALIQSFVRLAGSGARFVSEDLETHVRDRSGDGPVVRDLAAFGDAIEGSSCGCMVSPATVSGDGRVLLGIHSPRLRRDVRRGDGYLGGVLFCGDPARGTCRVAARVMRVVCDNGIVVATHRVAVDEAYERAPETTVGSIEATVRAGFSGRKIDEVTDALRIATEIPEHSALHALERVGLDRPPGLGSLLEARFRRGGDLTVHGAVNALTATARDARDPTIRERLERLAGRLVLALRHEEAAVPV